MLETWGNFKHSLRRSFGLCFIRSSLVSTLTVYYCVTYSGFGKAQGKYGFLMGYIVSCAQQLNTLLESETSRYKSLIHEPRCII